MNIKRFLLATALTTMIIFTLTGCGSFDASAYMKACLDANTHGEFEEYSKITHTDIKTIDKQYNAMLDGDIAYLDTYRATDEQKAKFRELFMRIYKSFKYEVGEATKNNDGTYNVPITTYKLMILKNVIPDGEKYITEYVSEQADAGKNPSTEEKYSAIIDFMYDEMEKNYEAKEYGEPVIINVTVGPLGSNSNIYGISEKELHSLLQNFIDIENAS